MRARVPDHDGYLFLHPHHVPEPWKGRAIPVLMVPLLPEEAGRLLQGDAVAPQVGPEDEGILRLVAQGLSVKAMARSLGMSPRGLQHRLGRLRRRFGAASTVELAALLARRGFTRDLERKQDEKGGSSSRAETT